ncbi:MAG TPA: hypothetical protein VFY65_14985 [Longimicrobium sp.]|nr:hypothetical protein [Longimicrobium sp.]
MSIFTGAGSAVQSLLWGAAHALDIGGVLLAEQEWGGLEADAEAIRGDWLVALHFAEECIHASEAGEEE